MEEDKMKKSDIIRPGTENGNRCMRKSVTIEKVLVTPSSGYVMDWVVSLSLPIAEWNFKAEELPERAVGDKAHYK